MKRISKDNYYLEIAHVVSKRSTCLRRHYGAVVVNHDEIVATGYNGSARGDANCCDIYEECPRKHKAHNSDVDIGRFKSESFPHTRTFSLNNTKFR